MPDETPASSEVVPGRGLRQQHGVADPVAGDLLLHRRRQALDEAPLQVLLPVEHGERRLLGGEVGRGVVGRVADGAVDALDHRDALVRAVGDVQLDQGVGQAHRAQPGAPRAELGAGVLVEEVLGGVDDVVQEAHGDARRLGQGLVVEDAGGVRGAPGDER